RAEYRLILRQDNCDERLMPLAFNSGYLEKEVYEKRRRIWEKKKDVIERFKSHKIYPEEWNDCRDEKISKPVNASDLLKRPEISIDDILQFINIDSVDNEFLKISIESDVKYQGFIEKHLSEIEKMKKYESAIIPDKIDYDQICGLLNETKSKLKKIRPQTLGQASRIPGVTPSDISVLTIHLTKYRH
ncbi:MAG: tRNA uridine-5-carboxymethylaminomethyl(34) synthesis enzyme MnmG, partial [Fibrobacter sp.]|nr:tRNA uridine-5-carboxymethylaminomethyl(34) synthesis enzyme MnmG [Fibrobacter sp.]